MTLPNPKTEVGQGFSKRLTELADSLAANYPASLGLGPAKWYRPSGITQSLSKESGNVQVHGAFSRSEQEKWWDEATKDRKDRGTVGDFYQIQLQGDMLACMERSYRLRHKTAIQDRIYTATRQKGQGDQYGVVREGLLGYVKNIDLLNKGEDV